MNPITIPNISIPTIGIPTIGIPSVGFPSASGGGLAWPAGLKESIKAIYDPKKQGMTNYDVIEAYTEDFSKNPWNNKTEKYVGNLTSKTLTVTEVLVRSALIYTNIKPYNFKVRITGLINNQKVIFGDDTSQYRALIVDKDGIYDINWEDNHNVYCIWIDFIGECNITITQLPTSILKDFSGNGNHAYLYGGKGKLNSGMGVYQQDFSKLIISRVDKKQDPFSFTVSGSGGTYLAYMQLGNWNNKAFKILANINAKSDYLHLRFRNNTDAVITSVALKNGENIIPAQNIEGATKAVFEYSLKEGETITITQIPDYPDQLCYDGKMYAVCYGFPILTDYTVMADRTWFENRNVFLAKGNITTEAKYAFIFERFKPDGVMAVQSFGAWNDVVSTTDSCISYLTKNKYNGIDIRSGIGADDDMLSIGGALNKGNIELTSVCCHGKIIVADRSFTEDEITWLKDNFFTIDIPTPAYDFDFSKLKSGENTFTDKYGNELSLHNFAWAGMSGKDGYYTDFNSWQFYPSLSTVEHSSEKLIIKKVNSTAQFCASDFVGKFTAEVSGIPEGVSFYYRYIDKTTGNAVSTTLSNGINEVDCSNANGDANMTNMFLIGADNKDINIVIRQIPVYPNALVFDGIDDYASFLTSPKLIKSVIIDFIPLKYESNHGMVYDQRFLGTGSEFAILHAETFLAYSARNNGDTYIDGVLNTTFIPNQLTGRHMQVVITNNNVSKVNNPINIGCTVGGGFYTSMALYRITGFTEVLTPDQIWKWYQKNQPKGGDK